MRMRMFAFVSTSNRNEVVCKEVTSPFVRGMVAIIHMYDRYSAIQKFQEEYAKKAWGRSIPLYDVKGEDN